MARRDVREFHARHAGVTSRAFARGGSYDRLVARTPLARVLEVGCGDGYLLSLLAACGCEATGIDLSPEEVALANARGQRAIVACARQLPFDDGTFDVVVSHLALDVMDDLPRVISEIDRVLVAGGRFIAMVGGGPTADGRDAFHRFLELAKPRGPRIGDRRAATEAGWRALFAMTRRAWRITFERCEIDLSGTFDEVWTFLSSGYQAFDASVRGTLAGEYAGHVPCSVVMWLATADRSTSDVE